LCDNFTQNAGAAISGKVTKRAPSKKKQSKTKQTGKYESQGQEKENTATQHKLLPLKRALASLSELCTTRCIRRDNTVRKPTF
jgi:hypothetical protein